MESGEEVIGFAMGYFEQYSDLSAYDLVEIVIKEAYQNKGIGAQFMIECERRAKEKGVAMMQLTSENDEIHNYFYGKLNYNNASNLILKSKGL